jgi:hypothetical protein
MRWEFRNVALSTQDMAPDTVRYPFFISGILDAKDGGNVLGLEVFRWSDFTASPSRFSVDSVSWPGMKWACSAWLSLVGGR